MAATRPAFQGGPRVPVASGQTPTKTAEMAATAPAATLAAEEAVAEARTATAPEREAMAATASAPAAEEAAEEAVTSATTAHPVEVAREEPAERETKTVIPDRTPTHPPRVYPR